MAERTRRNIDAWTFNLWHETHLLSPWTAICFRCWTTPDRRAPVEVLLAIAREAPVVDALPQHLAEMKLLRVSRAPKYRR